MVYGTVVRVQTPMLMTFNEKDAAFVIESLAHSLEVSYQMIDFFLEKDEIEEGVEEW